MAHGLQSRWLELCPVREPAGRPTGFPMQSILRSAPYPVAKFHFAPPAVRDIHPRPTARGPRVTHPPRRFQPQRQIKPCTPLATVFHNDSFTKSPGFSFLPWNSDRINRWGGITMVPTINSQNKRSFYTKISKNDFLLIKSQKQEYMS